MSVMAKSAWSRPKSRSSIAKARSSNCFFLLSAAYETTAALIGGSLLCLLQHPEAMAVVRGRRSPPPRPRPRLAGAPPVHLHCACPACSAAPGAWRTAGGKRHGSLSLWPPASPLFGLSRLQCYLPDVFRKLLKNVAAKPVDDKGNGIFL